jgi:hypothetical protein
MSDLQGNVTQVEVMTPPVTAAEVAEMLRLGSTIEDYENLTRLARALEKAMELIKGVEWSSGDVGGECPICCDRNHRPDCDLDRLLRNYYGDRTP